MNNRKGLASFGSKSVLLIGALALIFVCTAGNTLAWMFDKTSPITNTFVVGDISIALTESDTDGDGDDKTNSYSFEASEEGEDLAISKDAVVTVGKGSEDCWVFVKVEESDNFRDYLEYSMAEYPEADGWKQLKATDLPKGTTIWYLKAQDISEDKVFDILKDRSVYAKGTVSQEELDALEEKDYPTLIFSAYAIQMDQVSTPEEAWEKLN